MVSESAAALLIAAKTDLHNIVPPLLALKIPASVIAPVETPAAQPATYATLAAVTVELVKACLAPNAVSRAVYPAAAAVEPVPTPI